MEAKEYSKFTQRRTDQKSSVKPYTNDQFRTFFKEFKKEEKKVINEKILTVEKVIAIIKNERWTGKEKRTKFVELVASIHYSHGQRMHKDSLLRLLSKNLTNFDTLDENQVQELIQNVNQILLRNEIKQPLKYDFPEIKIGNEFTFTCNDFTNFKSESRSIDSIEADHDKNDVKVYNTKIGFEKSSANSWIKVMSSYGYKGEEIDPGKKGEKRLYYSFELEGGEKWGYIVSLDDHCIEIITDPTPASNFVEGEVANMIDLFIFDVANKIGVAAHETAGGGHINIDRQGAFGEDHSRSNLAKFLKAFYKDRDYWKKQDPDPVNAPFADELGISSDELDSWLKLSDDKFLKKIESEVFTKTHAGLDRRRLEDTKRFDHYQAVNTEHYNDEDYNAQRVEVRRVKAQTDRKKLAEVLDRIFKLLR